MDCRRRQNREYAAMRSKYTYISLFRTKQVRDNNYFYVEKKREEVMIAFGESENMLPGEIQNTVLSK